MMADITNQTLSMTKFDGEQLRNGVQTIYSKWLETRKQCKDLKEEFTRFSAQFSNLKSISNLNINLDHNTQTLDKVQGQITTVEQKIEALLGRDNELNKVTERLRNIETQMKTLSTRFSLLDERELPKLRLNADAFNLEKSDIYSRLLISGEQIKKLEGMSVIGNPSAFSSEMNKADKRKLNTLREELDGQVKALRRTQISVEELQREQIKESEVDTRINFIINRELTQKVESLAKKFDGLTIEFEEVTNHQEGVLYMKKKLENLEETTQGVQKKREEDRKKIESMCMDLLELTRRIEVIPSSPKELDLSQIRELVRDTFQNHEDPKTNHNIEKMLEETSENLDSKMDTLKKRVQKLETFPLNNPQIDHLRKRLDGVSENMVKGLNELRELHKKFLKPTRNLQDDLDYNKIWKDMETIIIRKWEDYTQIIEDKLKFIASSKSYSDEAPKRSFEGKTYIYKTDCGETNSI